MAELKQSLAWWCYNRPDTDPKRFMQTVKQIGYSAIEQLPRDLWDTAREAGLVISAHGGHASLSDGLNRHENHSRIEDEVNEMLEQAVKYQIPKLIVFSGNRNGLSDDEGATNTAEGLRRV